MTERRHWLVKSEPETFSFDDLLAAPKRTTQWDGVRNYAARNHLRAMRRGDHVLFYHSNADPPAVVGVAEVAREAYPDHTAFDPADPHFDPKSKEGTPTWYMVDLRAVEKLHRPVTLPEIKAAKSLAAMELIRLGRLSVQAVTAKEFEAICRMGAQESAMR